jgi:hypothetical protein
MVGNKATTNNGFLYLEAGVETKAWTEFGNMTNVQTSRKIYFNSNILPLSPFHIQYNCIIPNCNMNTKATTTTLFYVVFLSLLRLTGHWKMESVNVSRVVRKWSL